MTLRLVNIGNVLSIRGDIFSINIDTIFQTSRDPYLPLVKISTFIAYTDPDYVIECMHMLVEELRNGADIFGLQDDIIDLFRF